MEPANEHEVIAEMNRLWKLLSAADITPRGERTARSAFVQCQQWLSSHKCQYYQEEHTGEWKLR